MRHILFGGVLAASVLFGASAWAQDEVNWMALPEDRAALAELDNEQSRAVRAAVRYCEAFLRSSHQGNPCVFTDVDRAMRRTDNAALRAYHFALPRTLRYQEIRNQGLAIDRVLQQRNKRLQ
ncbi:hypothetical protein Plav_2218 [Parvibaculum lavamentivorans DS-1]|uniref:UrcA family protein n=1 Tax=Parvibaculum lavamentivorans (strain DS-1 / DSM 13023 / NCIMB 13966) TaxID=402881 RepID=A7HV99_PARL1|nr:hypothetical protein [Parvibaculum lavamentivorans]ABS63832.1 hypothetical protein Plav_2218 [Parvibaculum lavamentivorans DS-1]